MPLAEKDRATTAFNTNTGHCEYLRMTFGLKSASSTVQSLMDSVFMWLMGTRCFVHLVDIIIFGETIQEHHVRLQEVFEKLRQFNLKIEHDKCEFLKNELNYLEHVLRSDPGIKGR